MSAGIVRRDQKLSQIADEVHKCLDRGREQATALLETARDTGAWLKAAKGVAGTGYWGEWLAENFKLKKTTVAVYIQIHENWGLIESSGHEDLSIRRAAKLITDERKKKKDAEKRANEGEKQSELDLHGDAAINEESPEGHETHEGDDATEEASDAGTSQGDASDSVQGELVLDGGCTPVVNSSEVSPTELLDDLWLQWDEKQRKEALSWFAQFDQKARPPKKSDRESVMFKRFWAVVNRKVGLKASQAAFHKAARVVAEDKSCSEMEAYSYLIDRMIVFAESPAARDEYTGKLHPATWLNQGRYDDDEQEWFGGQDAQDLEDYILNG